MATNNNSNDEGDLHPGVDAALRTRFSRIRNNSGAEPEGLEAVARYVDGDLPPAERLAVEARLAAEPELRALVDELAKLEAAQDMPSNVIPLVIPAGRAARVGYAAPGSVRSRPLAEPKKNPLRAAVIGIGLALAIAAVLFLVTRPALKTEGTQGAGIGERRDSIAIGFESGQAVLEVDAVRSGELAVLIATPSGTRAAGLCDARTCLVTQDRLALRAGKNAARAVIGSDNGSCAFVLALTANGPNPTSDRSAAYVDPHAAAKALGTVVSKETCVLESLDRLQGVSGARHVAFMKVP